MPIRLDDYWWHIMPYARRWWYEYGHGIGCYGSGFAFSRQRAIDKAKRKVYKLKLKDKYVSEQEKSGRI